MKNSLISIFLFIILIIALFYLDKDFTSVCNYVILSCEEIEEHILKDELNEAFEKSSTLLEYIQSEQDIPAIYLNHMDYDVLVNEALRLCLYTQKSNSCEALASVHLLKFNAMHLRNLQKPALENIL